MLISNDLKYAKINQPVLSLAKVFIAVLTMSILAFFSTSSAITYSTKARISEVLIQFPAVREKIMSDYTYSGRWPEKTTLQKNDTDWSNYIGTITFDGSGAIHFMFNRKATELSGKVLSFVASHSTARMSDKIIWNCGFSEPVVGFTSIGKNQTTVEKKHLPGTCR